MTPIHGSLLVVVVSLMGCGHPPSGTQQPPATVTPPPKIAGLPLKLSLKQRSTTPIPGAGDMLSVTVDDITDGQVMVAVLGKDEHAIAGPVSLAEGDPLTFRFGGSAYVLRLVALSNALLGEDSATIVLDVANNRVLSETQKIEKLILSIEALEDATFIRNGQSHSSGEAARHLRQKWNAAGDHIRTAQDFIEFIASKSSLTGEEYLIRTPDGTTITAGDYLTRELSKLEGEDEGEKEDCIR